MEDKYINSSYYNVHHFNMMAIYNENNLPWEFRNLSQCEAFKL